LIGWLAIAPLVFVISKEDVEFDFGCFAVSMLAAYIFIYQGGTIKDIATGIIAAM